MKPMCAARKCRFPSTLAAVLAVAGLVASAAGEERWSHAAWRYRRAVTVPAVSVTRLAGDDVAYVTFFTGGLSKPDGSDIRVANQSGQEVPSRVLNAGPGDQVTVAFALRGMGNTYYVYFGNADAGPPPPMDLHRGVLLEAWHYDGRGVRDFQQMQEVLQSPGDLVGRAFRPDIFLGYNPFGPEDRMLGVYTGYLVCPWSGEYIFCTASQDASFLCVDDKLVVANGGQHGPQPRGRILGRVTLDAGLHRLNVYHACTGAWFPVIVAAWQPPGAMQIKPIPSSAFAEVIEVKPAALEDHQGGVTADFMPEHAGEAFLGPGYLQRYSFKAVAGEPNGPCRG